MKKLLGTDYVGIKSRVSTGFVAHIEASILISVHLQTKQRKFSKKLDKRQQNTIIIIDGDDEHKYARQQLHHFTSESYFSIHLHSCLGNFCFFVLQYFLVEAHLNTSYVY